jgi:hypothetical protein
MVTYCTVQFTRTELLKPLERGPCQRSRQQHGQTRGVLSFWSTGVGCSGRNQGAGFARLYRAESAITQCRRITPWCRHAWAHGIGICSRTEQIFGSTKRSFAGACVCIHTCVPHIDLISLCPCVCAPHIHVAATTVLHNASTPFQRRSQF